jgi:hypothetical protein
MLRLAATGATMGGGFAAFFLMVAGVANVGSLSGLVFAAILWAVYFGTSDRHD